ncbi:UPF0058 family protein [Halanaeroarchaeum sulfurireducens]|uniref:Metal-binding protein n=1 Tax=Halanaeroarchaeum sulfurireducens TaxID=1604004 RepID=A0A0F7P9H6_9EURY|nr:UPF0058 family protein [Halanaeroarchaeum sulfurireducens]AKH97791.1 hypothetical protein HLASF_1305 [Halanaeroarchaeum sulfurireducens]ALG82185.1 hypothetical protein HLASA_1292 [Halanaeroarchaeum sulfurireducens]
MHKDELLELHEEMVNIKDQFLEFDHISESAFSPYEELDVDPSHVHKSKSEHKHAVFVLGNAIAAAMSEDEFSSAGRISKRMAELADDASQKL